MTPTGIDPSAEEVLRLIRLRPWNVGATFAEIADWTGYPRLFIARTVHGYRVSGDVVDTGQVRDGESVYRSLP